MSPIQQMLLGVGAVATKTYVDDIFSTFLYAGTGANRSINNGIDMSSSGGGLTWIKKRTSSESNYLFDTERGSGKYIQSNGTNAEATNNDYLSAFNNNGFSLGDYNDVNGSGQDYASWTFRKAPGFFDVVTYSGNGTTTGRAINHGLKSKPGFIIVKRLDSGGSAAYKQWFCYHDELPDTYQIKLSSTDPKQTNGNDVFGTGSSFVRPTSTQFTVGEFINFSGGSYVAYLFAGGESTAATARSVDFDGSGDYLLTGSSSDFTMGTGDFTVEGWFKTESYDKVFLAITDSSTGFSTSAANITLWVSSSGFYTFNAGNGEKSTSVKATKNQWEHLAYVRHNGTTSLYVNGTFVGSKADTYNYNGAYVNVGAGYASSFAYDGKISNFRVVKGTAVYTSSFRPPTEPLTSISGTGLLCCNNSSVTGTTTGSVSSNGNPTASTDHPFDDPAGFVFGESGSENVIKTGSYVGTSSDVHVYTGGEAEWVMVKNTSRGSTDWYIVDVLRGAPVANAPNCKFLLANTNGAEGDLSQLIVPTAQGFIARTGAGYAVNYNGDSYVYIAIRRPDGYVGKPPELGSEVFAMDGSGAGTPGPSFISNFPVDFGLTRKPAASQDWYTGARLLGSHYLKTNSTSDASTDAEMAWDYSNGFVNGGFFGNSANQGWMWKRGAGMDVVCYEGNSTTGHQIPHSLSKSAEMIWIKRRSPAEQWVVGHKGLDGGNQPWTHILTLNTNAAEVDSDNTFNDTAPVATHFTLGDGNYTNNDGDNYIAMLFASVDGISKVGYYTGNGSSTGPVITTGFTPRFILFKNASSGGNGWAVLDTVRGLGTSSQDRIWLDWNEEENAGGSGSNFVTTTSTSFQPVMNNTEFNENGSTIIYYAHA